MIFKAQAVPSIIVECQFCGKKNRIPSDRIGQRAKCGSCGKVISEIADKSDLCLLCHTHATNGIHLSTGKIIHEFCLKSLQDRKELIQTEILTKQSKINQIQDEIAQRNRIAFKVKTFFSKPDIAIDELKRSISTLNLDIEKLTSLISQTKSELTSIYDFFLSYPPDWDERRKALISIEGNYCSKCGRQTDLHVHHKKPLSEGGSNKVSNLELLCEECHLNEHGGRDSFGEFTHNETAFSKRVANIRYAIENGKRIRFGYRKPTDEGFKKRTVHPALLIDVPHHHDSESTLCVRGYCELRRAERTFALKRMRGLKII